MAQDQHKYEEWKAKPDAPIYWEKARENLFVPKDFPLPKLTVDPVPKYDDLIYNIRKHKIDKVKEEIKKDDRNPNKFKGTTIVRNNGDTILHVCAESNQPDLFQWFIDHYDADYN